MDNLLLVIIIGIVAGWLAGRIMRKRSYGLVGNLIIGVAGAMIGAYIFEFIGLPTRGTVMYLIMAVVGAVTLLYLIQLIKKI